MNENIPPMVANENNPNHNNVVQVDAYKIIVAEKRKLNQSTVTEHSNSIKRATKVSNTIY